MTIEATCYHLRNMQGQKVVGGTLPRNMSLEDAANWLVEGAELTVTNSGQVHFLYGKQPVWVYLSVDPLQTEKGRLALKAWRDEERNRLDREAELNRDHERELEDLVDEIGLDEVIRLLKERRNEGQDE